MSHQFSLQCHKVFSSFLFRQRKYDADMLINLPEESLNLDFRNVVQPCLPICLLLSFRKLSLPTKALEFSRILKRIPGRGKPQLTKIMLHLCCHSKYSACVSVFLIQKSWLYACFPLFNTRIAL